MKKEITIEIANLQADHKINRGLLRKVLAHTMKDSGTSGTLSLAVVDEEEITNLNKRFLGRAGPTDVLSFPMGEGESEIFGEVVICADVAAQEAKERGISFDAELTLYALHGLLHLLGYDDLKAMERERMRKREQEILEIFDLAVS